MKLKINLLMTGVGLLIASLTNAQTWTYSPGNTNAYLNPTSSTISFGTSSAPTWAGVKVDVTGGSIRVNSYPILLQADNNHGLGYFNTTPYFTTTGPFASKAIDGPVLYGFGGGALGSNQGGTKNISLRWLPNGNVGIGTNAPEDQFQVSGTSSAANKIVMGSASGGNLSYGTAYLGFNMSRQNLSTWSTASDGANNGGASIFSNLQGSLFFSVTPTTGNVNRTGITDATIFANTKFFIRGGQSADNGQVGIGTSNPLARLQINSSVTENALDIVDNSGTCNFRVKSNGFAYARDLTVQAGAFPDYVFAKEYKLRSLSEVHSYIEKNGHLPEMPTATEVEKDGMSVSKINLLLVQKVEELTLYVIKLQEEVDQLKATK